MNGAGKASRTVPADQVQILTLSVGGAGFVLDAP